VAVVTFDHIDVVFGPNPQAALKMLDNHQDRDHIFKTTQNLVAVRDACLKVAKGQICVLMGLSGSGKSSLLRCVNGLNKVTRGRVVVRGDGQDVDVTRCGRKALHDLRTNQISMVFQQFALMPWRTVHENVAFGLDLAGISGAERDRIVDEKLEMVRLSKWTEKYPHQLSGGMQQRVGLARALATDARILLMDEPFSALDPLIREHLQDELLQIQEDLRRTILFVSHDLDEALKLGSLIAIMEAGRIVQIGTPEDIVTHPANDYVRRFVASMNPLKVLRCGSIMRPVSLLQQVNGDSSRVWLDSDQQYSLCLDSNGRPEKSSDSECVTGLVAYTPDVALSKDLDDTCFSIDLETPIRVAVEIYYATGKPMPVVDPDGKMIGVITIHEILKGILQKRLPTFKGDGGALNE
jgi:glycine betaine/proline transport system ATP-binding protein